jgi:hypothetical protein
MKKTTIAYLLAAVSCYIMISSYNAGPGTNGWDCTGAETGLGNPAGCTGGGCHAASATTGISVAIELDSVGGVPTTHYKGGMSYKVKLSGTNNTANLLPNFGFQMGSIKGSVAVTTPTNAGTWTSPYPTNTHYSAPQAGNFVVGVVEQTTRLAPTSGTGGSGTTYVETFNWTAPATGTGAISFWAALNAVNNSGTADAGDLWNTNHVVISEWPNNTSAASVEQNLFNMNIFPNPASDYAVIDYTLEESADVKADIFDVSGKKVSELLCEKQNVGEHHQRIDLAAMNLKRGVYFVILKAGNNASARKLVVQ